MTEPFRLDGTPEPPRWEVITLDKRGEGKGLVQKRVRVRPEPTDDEPEEPAPRFDWRALGEHARSLTAEDWRHRLRLGLVLVAACLRNRCVREFQADPKYAGWYTPEKMTASPVVRVKWQHCHVVARLGEALGFGVKKSWGEFEGVEPLGEDDPVHPERLLYVYQESNSWDQRFQQRRRLRKALGRAHARLVRKATQEGREAFIRGLGASNEAMIEERLGLKPGEFWRLARGLVVVKAEPPRQGTLF